MGLRQRKTNLHHKLAVKKSLQDVAPAEHVFQKRDPEAEEIITDLILRKIDSPVGELTLVHPGLKALPAEIGRLSNLQKLRIKSGLSKIPDEIGLLTKLKTLELDKNDLSELPVAIGALSELQQLTIEGNVLEKLPSELGMLGKLETLDLSNNRLTELPESLHGLTSLKGLFLHGNPELGIPAEILGPKRDRCESRDGFTYYQGGRPADILDYYFRSRGKSRPLNEVKLLLVGRGSSGKSSIRDRLVFDTFDNDRKETPGIEITHWRPNCGEHEVQVHVWDFAGQEITHATHQFFLTERSVYLLVLDARADTQDADADYWLQLIAAFGKESPVIIILNKTDEKPFCVDENVLRERHPAVRAFIHTDCKSGRGMQELRAELSALLCEWKDVHRPIAEPWWQVKEHFTKLQKEYIPFSEFCAICARHGVNKSDEQEQLARILHALGIILHFADDPRLRHNAVLNPHWVTNGVYKLLRLQEGPESNGLLTVDAAIDALPGETREMAEYLIGLMRRFELCFSIDPHERLWLVPQLLSRFQPTLGNEWGLGNTTRLRYKYDILTEGLLPRFIVRTHPLSDGGMRWRNGVVLRLDGAQALVRADRSKNRVTVVLIGTPEAQLRLVKLIRGHFARIHADLPGLNAREELEVEGYPDIFKSVKVLEADERKGGRSMIETDEGSVAIDEKRELDRISAPAKRDLDRPRLRLFVSYSHKDAKLLDVFRGNLDLLREDGLVEWWFDGLIAPSSEWDCEIRHELEQADIIVLLISTAFLQSKYIRGVELVSAARRRAAGQVEIAVVLLEQNCAWKGPRNLLVKDTAETILFGLDQYQFLLPEGRAVRQTNRHQDAFNLIEQKLRKLITLVLEKREKNRSAS